MQLHDDKQSNRADNIQGAEIRLPSEDLTADLGFFMKTLGFRMDKIYPADYPTVSVLSGHGLTIRLEQDASEPPGTLRILCRDPAALAGGETELTAPNGTRIEIVQADPPLEIPPTQHAFLVRRLKDNTPWVIGRAGMHYRDLVPGRLGGSIIASHIRIPDAGPVPDVVHYHTVGFQLIFAYRGEVKLVYEDQGPPFMLKAGDCVIQPPEIRHRVLESSENLQVIEIGVPADHVTTIDHEVELPTQVLNPDRVFGGQTFCRHQLKDAVWEPWRIAGFEARETGIGKATDGVASVQVARATDGADSGAAGGDASGSDASGSGTDGGPDGRSSGGGEQVTSHTGDILFTFVMEGEVTLNGENQVAHRLEAGDAYVIPPHTKTSLTDRSTDLELLEVALPAQFETIVH
ncbi:MAG: cupin domain-containing protein [Gemmatimonadetes bacterium]|nr:cupin domain-containing protein [Gemmatimonadota bacterium]MYG84007.1 cupin domain-containing protein [Gemmatimonadota bacterium]MYJ88370.1 cupin domain-containing protein [Gemmatimonadota bacterium]